MNFTTFSRVLALVFILPTYYSPFEDAEPQLYIVRDVESNVNKSISDEVQIMAP
jgi:hypothetical protein